MQVHNQTDFTFGAFPGRLDFPAHSLTIVVKGAFDLVPGGVARLAEEPSSWCESSGRSGRT